MSTPYDTLFSSNYKMDDIVILYTAALAHYDYIFLQILS